MRIGHRFILIFTVCLALILSSFYLNNISSEENSQIIPIIDAEHLDSDGKFISNILDKVGSLDNIFSEKIKDGEFVRVTFKKNLTNKNDITIYAKSLGEFANVDVYPINREEYIGTISNITSFNKYQMLLTNLKDSESYAVFDLKSRGIISYDYIVDPITSNLPYDKEAWFNYQGGGCSPYGTGETNLAKKVCRELTGGAYYYPTSVTCQLLFGEGRNSFYYSDSGDNDNYAKINTSFAGSADYYYLTSVTCATFCDLNIDSAKPNVTLTSPADNSIYTSLGQSNVNFTVSLIDNCFLKNVTLKIYNQNNVLFNQTLITFNPMITSKNLGITLNLTEGIYNWAYHVSDNKSNYNQTINRTLIFDATKPTYSINSPQSNQNLTSGPLLNFSINITDNVAIKNLSIYLYNSSGFLINRSIYTYSTYNSSINRSYSFNLSEGNYTWFIQLGDYASNYNTTENRTFILDYNAPTIMTNYPTNNQLLTVKPTSLNFTSFDYPAGLDECWYGYTDLEYGYTEPSHVDCNTLFSPGINYSSEGDNTWYLYAKDNWGQIRGTTLNFTVYTEKPRVIYNSNTFSSGNYSASNIFVNVTFVGNSFANVTIYLYNSSGWSDYLFNYSANSSNSISKNFGGLLDGTYFINATCIDLFNNYNYTDTRVIRLDSTKPLLDFGYNVLGNNANTSARNIYVNVSSIDTYFKNVTFTLTNSTPGVVYSQTFSSSIASVNWSVSYDDAFDYTILSTDWSNNQNTTSRRINIDSVGPLFSSIGALTGGNSANLSLEIGDSPAGISSAWIALYYSNGTYIQNYSLTRNSGDALSGNYNITLEGLSLGTDYTAVIYSNDSLNTLSYTNKSFDIYPSANFIINLSSDTSNYLTDLTFYIPGTKEILVSNSSSSNSFSFSVKNRLYDLNVTNANNTIIFKNINMSSNSSLVIQNIDDANATNVSGYKVLSVFGVELNDMGLIGEAELSLDYSGKFDISLFPAISESELTVHKCSDWNFSVMDCLSSWSLVSGSYVDSSNDKVLVNVSSFSAYAVTEDRCGNGICEAYYGETIASCSADCGTGGTATPAPAGGGGGGGTPSTNSLSFSTASIEKSVMVGTEELYPLSLTNTKSTSSVAILSLDGDIETVASFDDSIIEIPGSSSEIANLRISAVKEGVYTGFILVKSGSATTKVPIRVIVTGKNDKLLDLNIDINEKKVQLGEELEFKITAFNLGRLSRYDLNIQSEVVNVKTNKSIVSNQEAIAIETSLNLERTLQIPEDAETGEYVLIVRAFYDELSATAMSKFSIYKSWTIPLPTVIKENLPLALAILFLAIISIIAYYYFSFIRKKLFEKEMAELRKKSPYPFPDFYALPKSKFAYVGMVADAKVKTYLDYTQLNRHTLIAGGTGSGKTIAGMVLAEELIKRKSSVIVFDPVGQWTGFAKKNAEKIMTSKFRKFGMFSPRAFPTRIIDITKDTMAVDILEYMRKGGLTVFKLNGLTPNNADIFIEHCLNRIYRGNLSEASSLKTLLVLDEVHRLLPKYGGRRAYMRLEQAVREFRKWGIGLLMISQVLTDFKGAIRGNIGTEIQMFSRYEGDIDRVKKRHGSDVSKLIPKLPVGLGMVEAGGYNKGNPYFVEFRPIYHSPLKLTDVEMKKYLEKNPYLEKSETAEEKKIRAQMEKDNSKKAKELIKEDRKKEREEDKEQKEAEKEKVIHTKEKEDLKKNKHINKMFSVKHHDKEKVRKKEDVKVARKEKNEIKKKEKSSGLFGGIFSRKKEDVKVK